MNEIPLVTFIIFSMFTMNLTLQMGLGIKWAVEAKNYGQANTFIKLTVMFFTVVLVWFVFSRIIFSLSSGIFIYVILFPVSYMIYEGLDFLLFKYILKKDTEDKFFPGFPGGITAAAVFICLNITDIFIEAVVLAFGFSAGILLVFVVIMEIRNRASLEEVPRFLRGKPMVLVAMSLLSLVFSTASLIILRMTGAG